MTNKNTLAKDLIEVEIILNSKMFKGIRIGALLSKYNEYLFGNRMQHRFWWWVILQFVIFFVKGIFISRPSKTLLNKKKILLFKLADKNQCNKLIDPLKVAYSSQSILYTPGHQNELSPCGFTRKVNVLFFLQLLYWLLRNGNDITNEYTSRRIQVNSFQLSFHLMIQLVAAYNWYQLLSNTEIKIIVVDFDRDAKSSALIMGAKLLNIKTITLVHGVINPPFGYYPIIADQIWLWSSFQKRQLEKIAGEALVGCKIVGNPIVEYLKMPEKKHQQRLTIGVAVNPMGAEINKKFLANIFCHDKNFKDIHWIIKLHPSMDKSSFQVDLNHPIQSSVSILDFNEISNEVFFNSVDLMIVGNSGFGFEAVVNGVPIAVIRHSNTDHGHDFVMVHDFACPDITSSKDFLSFFECIQNSKTFLHDLLAKEKSAILSEYYFAIGGAAEENIIRALAYELAC